MAFTPTSVTFNYKQYLPPLPPVVVRLDHDPLINDNPAYNIQIISLPPWLQASNIYYDDPNNQIVFTLNINIAYAFNMLEGGYNDNIKVRWKEDLVFGSTTRTSPNYPVYLNVLHTILLTLSPSVFSFGDYLIGDPAPPNQTLQIQSESNWNITAEQTWVTLSTTAGAGSGQVFIGANPTGLSVGTYESIIQVIDNIFTRTVIASLVVTEGDTETSYLYVNPTSMQFISELAVENTIQKILNMETSHAWTAVVSQSWLILSAASGAAGVQTINVSVDSEALTELETSYLATIVLTCNNIQKTVYVQLILVEFLIAGIESESIYFADDRNKLQITNIEANMFLQLEGILTNGAQNLQYTLQAPYHGGQSEVTIGLEANLMLKSVTPTNNFTSRVVNNFAPININFAAFNINKLNNTSSLVTNFQNVKFLKGATPIVPNKLSYIPSKIYVTSQGKISVSVFSEEDPGDINILVGAAAFSISGFIAGDLYVYNAIVDLSEYELNPQDLVSITFAGITTEVIIIEAPTETNLIAFENEWNEYELFETTGFLTTNHTNKKVSTILQVEGQKHTKVVSIDPGKTYTLNTGWIYTQEEVEWLSNILNSKRIFIYEAGEPIEIELTTKSLEVYKTRDHLRSYNLKFKKAIV